jgi:hypothetical protein
MGRVKVDEWGELKPLLGLEDIKNKKTDEITKAYKDRIDKI